MAIPKRFKRIFAVLMLAAAPFAYSEPISIYQEALPVRSPRIVMGKSTRPRTKSMIKQKRKTFKTRAVKGVASWYSKADDFINKHTANGEVFNDKDLTCASWHHPFGTRLKVTNLQNGKSVVCRVNDRGPAKRLRREIDLTLAAFKKISSPHRGLIRVSVSKQPGKSF